MALARTLRAQDQLEHAAVAYERALELKPDYDAAALERAALALEMARPDVAAAKLAPLAARRPRWADVHALLGRARLRLGDAAAAECSLRAALAIHPGFAVARADLGCALLQLGRMADADAEFAQALELDPLMPLPREALGWREMVLPTRGD
jgi:Flp pilus assembly protein TadD